ncbi:histone H1B-like [Pseudophryne corroboree]|uniref:histone H1B-like n=1 Tax=Pseudophryne corroboree TaxID=495146 RepID=UPI0030821531
MAETAPVATAVPQSEGAAKNKRLPKKAAGGAKKSCKSSGPSVSELIVKAVVTSKERSGVSLAALKKALAAGGYDVERNNSRIKVGVKGLVTKGTLTQVKGTGTSGSFKLNKKQRESKKADQKLKKPAVKKVAKSQKKPKKAPNAAKSPKKVKKPAKPAAAKSPKKPKTVKPKKAAKKAAKSKAAKSPAKKAAKPKATKSPAKRAAKPKKAAAK